MRLISYKLYNNPKASWLDYIVAIVSFGRYTHSELLFSNGLSLSIAYGKPAELILREIIDKHEWDTLNLFVCTSEEECLLEFVKENIVGREYDTGGALLSIFDICTLQSEDKVFCSEAIANLLNSTVTYRELDKGCKYSPVSLHKTIADINQKVRRLYRIH